MYKIPFSVFVDFLLGSSGPLPTKDGLKTPIFVVFSRFFGSQIFRSPAAPPHDVCYVFWGFSKIVQNKAPKNSESRGANSVARIPSPFSPRVYTFSGHKNSCSRLPAFRPQKRHLPETPYFLVFRHPKPRHAQRPQAKSGDRIPLFRGEK